jgi:hypothetical protein
MLAATSRSHKSTLVTISTDLISAADDRAAGGGHLPPLPLSVEPGSARLTVADREVEAITAAGLKGLGAAGGMGRHGLDRALRILPGVVCISCD